MPQPALGMNGSLRTVAERRPPHAVSTKTWVPALLASADIVAIAIWVAMAGLNTILLTLPTTVVPPSILKNRNIPRLDEWPKVSVFRKACVELNANDFLCGPT